eukprot:m.13750 g.13750  ORF g.13750 m.13750 type:complete len:289 (+) comp4649_c0_seq1:1702-2568(+)
MPPVGETCIGLASSSPCCMLSCRVVWCRLPTFRQITPTTTMAASASKRPAVSSDVALATYLTEVGAIEKRDSKMTSKDQIERLTKPGSKYLNLNPYEVLQVDPSVTEEEAKKQLRRFRILLHPDKNRDNQEGAQQAFDVVQQAYKALHDEEKMARISEIMEEAHFVTNKEIEEKKRKAKGGPIPEDSEIVKKELLRKITLKTFAEHERRKRELEIKIAAEKTRVAEKEKEIVANREKMKADKKAWEETRDKRVDSWRTFQVDPKKKKKKSKKLKVGLLKPPRLKQETR